MEGLDDSDPGTAQRLARFAADPETREWRLVERWLVFVFGVVLVGISIVALGFAAFVVR